MTRCLTLAAVLLIAVPAIADHHAKKVPAETGEYQDIFNGKDLSGWDGDSRLWSVKDGVIHGETTKENAARLVSIKNILVEKYGNPGSFDVKDKMKVSRWAKSAGQLKLTTLTGNTVMCAIEYLSVGTESEKL